MESSVEKLLDTAFVIMCLVENRGHFPTKLPVQIQDDLLASISNWQLSLCSKLGRFKKNQYNCSFTQHSERNEQPEKETQSLGT